MSADTLAVVPGFLRSRAMWWLVCMLACILLLIRGASYLLDANQVAAPVTCHPVIVTFVDDAPAHAVNTLLQNLQLTVAAGPDAHGAFALAVHAGQANAIVATLNTMTDVVLVASLNPLCSAEH